MKLSHQETDELVQRYLGYTRELSGPGVKPVPNFLSIHGVNDDTVTLERCERSLPLFAKMNPAPKVRAVSLGAGIHSWGWTDEKLPQGIVPPVAKALARRDHEWILCAMSNSCTRSDGVVRSSIMDFPNPSCPLCQFAVMNVLTI